MNRISGILSVSYKVAVRTKLNRGELQGCPVSGESVKKVGGPFLSQGKLRPPQQRTARKGAPSPVRPPVGGRSPSPQGRGLGSDPRRAPRQKLASTKRFPGCRLSRQHENRLATQRGFRKRVQENLSKHRWLVLERGRAYHGLQRTAGQGYSTAVGSFWEFGSRHIPQPGLGG